MSFYPPPAVTGVAASSGMFGTGSDGAITLDGTTTYPTLMSLSGSTYTLSYPLFATQITIDDGITLYTQGSPVYATLGITGTGTIDCSGVAATSSTGAHVTNNITGAAAYGANGGTSAGSACPAANPTRCIASSGGGGNGSSGDGGAGAGTGSVTRNTVLRAVQDPHTWLCWTYYSAGTAYTPSPSGGGGGGGDGTNAGGGGGSGAGMVLVAAPSIDPSITLSADGGGGYTPATGNCGGGGGGSGGLIVTVTLTAFEGTTSVTGGAAGSGAGTGTTGAAGSTGEVVSVVAWQG